MLNWLKWKLAGKELRELERWKIAWSEHDRWLALTHPAIELVLRNLRQTAEGKQSLDCCWPPSKNGPWEISRLREVLKTRYGIGGDGRELPDAIRVPLDELEADAGYLMGRVAENPTTAAAMADAVRKRTRAIRATLVAPCSAPQGTAGVPSVVEAADADPQRNEGGA